MTPDTLSLLKRAYHRIDDKRRWTQGAYARTREGREVDVAAESAACWCAEGALFAESDSARELDNASNELRNASIGLFDRHYVPVNDDLGYAAIRRVFRAAIKRLEKEA